MVSPYIGEDDTIVAEEILQNKEDAVPSTFQRDCCFDGMEETLTNLRQIIKIVSKSLRHVDLRDLMTAQNSFDSTEYDSDSSLETVTFDGDDGTLPDRWQQQRNASQRKRRQQFYESIVRSQKLKQPSAPVTVTKFRDMFEAKAPFPEEELPKVAEIEAANRKAAQLAAAAKEGPVISSLKPLKRKNRARSLKKMLSNGIKSTMSVVSRKSGKSIASRKSTKSVVSRASSIFKRSKKEKQIKRGTPDDNPIVVAHPNQRKKAANGSLSTKARDRSMTPASKKLSQRLRSSAPRHNFNKNHDQDAMSAISRRSRRGRRQ